MKIISKLKNFMNNEKDVPKAIKMLNGDVLETPNELVTLSDVKSVGIVTHGNGRKTNLLSAKLRITRPGDTIMVDVYKYVAFEIPAEISIQQALNRGILESLYENRAFENVVDDKYNSLGETKFINGQWSVTPSSNAVVNEINKLNSEIEEMKLKYRENAEKERQNQERMMQEKEYREGLEREKEKQSRINNPTFERKNVTQYGNKIEVCYSTVNMVNGNEITLNNVNKLGKDENGMYLYSARMRQGVGDAFADRLLKNDGTEILFATAVKLEQIAEMQNPKDIRNIANLVSVSMNDLDVKERNYLGQLDNDGKITRNIKDTSVAIRQNVLKLQEQYRRQIQDEGR